MNRTRRRMPSYRPWGSTEDGDIEFESLTEDTLEGALDVIRQSFFIHENVSVAVKLKDNPGACKELEELCLQAAKDGVSVVAIHVATGEVVGVAFNKMQVLGSTNDSSFEVFSSNCKHASSKALVDFMLNVDSRVNLFKHYNTTCILEIMFLATSQSHGKRRIGELLVSSTLELAKELKRGKNVKTPVSVRGDNTIENSSATPSLVSAIMTSTYSQKIATKCGFEALLHVDYKEFTFEGKTFDERIGEEHPRCTLAAKRLT